MGVLPKIQANALNRLNTAAKNAALAKANYARPTTDVNRPSTANTGANSSYIKPVTAKTQGVRNTVGSTGTTKSTYSGNSGSGGIISQNAAFSNVPNTAVSNTNQSIDSQYNLYQQAREQQRQNAQNAYNRNASAINSMYSNRLSGLNSRYNEGRSALDASHAAQQEAIRKAKEEAQRQAYISSMVAERDLEQNLSAQGLSGGASETTLAKMRNNYANNRNSNEEEYLNASADIGMAYQNELANLESQYLQLQDALEAAKAQAVMQNENALANSEASIIGQFVDYASNLDYLNASSALNLAGQEKMAAINQKHALEQMAIEQANKINYAQFSNSLSERSDILKTLKKLRANGYTDEDIAAAISSYS